MPDMPTQPSEIAEKRPVSSKRPIKVPAAALGAGSVGALAIGRLSIGRLRLRDARIDRLRIGAVEIEE